MFYKIFLDTVSNFNKWFSKIIINYTYNLTCHDIKSTIITVSPLKIYKYKIFCEMGDKFFK